jgi:inosine-uridine nucleoside N-ribohydrolase
MRTNTLRRRNLSKNRKSRNRNKKLFSRKRKNRVNIRKMKGGGIGDKPRKPNETLPKFIEENNGKYKEFLLNLINKEYYTPGKSYRIILDTDPGCDDSFFLACCIACVKLLNSQQIDIKICGITIVHGNNSNIEILTNAAARILIETKALELGVLTEDFMLIPGLFHTIDGGKPGENGTYVHGKFGLGFVTHSDEMIKLINAFRRKYTFKKSSFDIQFDLKTVDNPNENNAALFIYDKLRQKKENEEYIILAVGPLSNIARACQFDEGKSYMTNNLSKFVIMGGSLEMGNVKPLAEANWMNDANAVQLCLKKIKNIVCVPLNFTHQINIIRIINSLPSGNLPDLYKRIFERYFKALSGNKMLELKDGFLPTYNGKFIFLDDNKIGYENGVKKLSDDIFPNGIEEGGLPLHDGSAMLAFFFPGLIDFIPKNISIKTGGSINDFGNYPGVVTVNDSSLPPNVSFAFKPKDIENDVVHQVFASLLLYLDKEVNEIIRPSNQYYPKKTI